jgi:hypothetical protein
MFEQLDMTERTLAELVLEQLDQSITDALAQICEELRIDRGQFDSNDMPPN